MIGRLEELRDRASHAVEFLKKSLKSGRVSHAYMFYGDGELKEELALRFAQALFCRVIEDDACGECNDCRRVENFTHPDFSLVKPEGAVFKISQVRELRGEVSLRPPEGDRRVFILKNCEKMNLPAANALLKVLEEPPIWTVLILLVSHPSTLPPTVSSRCQVLFVGEEVKASFKETLLERIVALKDGDVRELYELSTKLGEMDREKVVSLLDSLMEYLLKRGIMVEIVDEISYIREGLSERFLNVQMAVDRILFRIKGVW